MGEPDQDLTGPPLLVDIWAQWQGSIRCGQTNKEWTSDELKQLADVAAKQIGEAGVCNGDRVALLLTNSAAFPVMLIALLQLGCNPFLVYAATREEELKRVIGEFGIAWALHDFVDGLTQLDAQTFPERTRFAIGSQSIALLDTSEHAKDSTLELSAEGVILHPTSGTYGRARYCIRNQSVAVAEARNYADTISFYDGIITRVTTPLSHAYAYGFGMITALLTNSTLVVDAAFNPKKVLREEAESTSDILTVVPPMVKALSALGRRAKKARMARHVFYAGAPCTPAAIEEFEGIFSVPLHAIYGTTETGGITSTYRHGERFGGIGAALENVSIEVRNQFDYSELGQNVGEIMVASTSMMQGYLATNQGEKPITWWPTADLGHLDEGALHIVGRTKDIINLGGMKVDPAQVEEALRSHPAVSDVAVYPGLSANNDEFVQAAVSLEDNNETTEALRQHCIQLLDAHKVPAKFHIVERIPRSPSGKCLKIQCPDFPTRFIVQ